MYGLRLHKDDWKRVDDEEMCAFFGLMLLAGVTRSKNENRLALWDEKFGPPYFPATMSLKRFKILVKCISFDDRQRRRELQANARNTLRDKLAPIRNLFDTWVARLKIMYVPGAFVTVDEQMVPYRGRAGFVQYLPNKPDKYGIKNWVAADAKTYYTYNMQVYVGRDRNCAPEVGQGERVVMDMTEGLDGRNITCDNFFTSHRLAGKLKRERRMTIIGTIRKNRVEIPRLLLDMKKKPVLHTEALYDHDLRACMISYVPKKRRFVTVLSTYHSSVEFVRDDPKKKPNIIKLYNETKGGVDVVDKLVSGYRTKRKHNRWSLCLFEHMLDISALNAYIIYTEIFPEWNRGKKYKRRLFLEELAAALCKAHIERRRRLPTNHHAAVNLIRSIRGDPLPSNSTYEAVLVGLEHAPTCNKRARCYKCANTKNSNKHSTRCDKCAKYVCTAHHYKVCEDCASTIRFE